MVRPALFDCVVLLETCDGWPAGSRGTLVDAFDEGGLVEIAHPSASRPDVDPVASVPWSAMRLEARAPRRSLV